MKEKKQLYKNKFMDKEKIFLTQKKLKLFKQKIK
jgi:hypothetical protein